MKQPCQIEQIEERTAKIHQTPVSIAELHALGSALQKPGVASDKASSPFWRQIVCRGELMMDKAQYVRGPARCAPSQHLRHTSPLLLATSDTCVRAPDGSQVGPRMRNVGGATKQGYLQARSAAQRSTNHRQLYA